MAEADQRRLGQDDRAGREDHLVRANAEQLRDLDRSLFDIPHSWLGNTLPSSVGQRGAP